ncbi:hypothetical protein [Streptoalloteichus hindustanus]|uniref:ABC-2 type transport system permease protein n=1 Tax=Streptoalloteichus hindustanus TaxID=2017 RepID=A0A1M5LW30_STRHI|nr:hypothetical protein [Streptoalloteichus hindustanus]SHG69257.1 hypothetical protein SAMN05444320_11282 [Streptoalloteichus hindustanus]
MTALVRYVLAHVGLSQRYLPPTFVLLVALAILYSDDPGPAMPAYVLTAGLLVPVTAWFAINARGLETPEQRGVTLVAAGGPLRVLVAEITACLLYLVANVALCLLWPQLAHGAASAAELGAGAVAHLTCGLVGIAIGLVCGRPLVSKVGTASLVGCGLVLAALLGSGVSPVAISLRLLGTNSATHEAATLVGVAVVAVAMVAAAAGAVLVLGRRRD